MPYRSRTTFALVCAAKRIERIGGGAGINGYFVVLRGEDIRDLVHCRVATRARKGVQVR